MQLNTELLKNTRIAKGWTQQQLADVAGLSLRTIQRIEKSGISANESCSALCVVLELNRTELLAKTASDSSLQSLVTDRHRLIFLLVFLAGVTLGILLAVSFR